MARRRRLLIKLFDVVPVCVPSNAELFRLLLELERFNEVDESRFPFRYRGLRSPADSSRKTFIVSSDSFEPILATPRERPTDEEGGAPLDLFLDRRGDSWDPRGVLVIVAAMVAIGEDTRTQTHTQPESNKTMRFFGTCVRVCDCCGVLECENKGESGLLMGDKGKGTELCLQLPPARR